MVKLIGICGREGAGKTTAANYIAPIKFYNKIYTHPWAYIISCLLGIDYKKCCLEIPNYLDRTKVLDSLSKDLHDFISKILNAFDTIFPYPIENNFAKKFTILEPISKKWIQLTLADPLKKVCVAFTGIPHKILLGNDTKLRKLRECKKYNIAGLELTGREVLEQIGTQVFRMNIDTNFWTNLMEKNIKNNAFKNIVIPDIRFKNEYEMLKKLDGKLLVICRNLKDLKLTETDKKQHPAKWEFITFSDKAQIIVNTTKENLYKTLDTLF